MDAKNPLDRLDDATRRYERTKKTHEDARSEAVEAVIAALQANERPTDVAQRSPFTDAYVRRIARENGIQAKPRGKT